MSDGTNIEWTDATWGIARGCARVSAGCGDATGGGCYAERMAHRFSGLGMPYDGLTRLTSRGPRWVGKASFVADALEIPLRWRKPRKVFVASMSDLFHSDITNEQIAAVFGVMAACPQHTFQVLTKRPERMVKWFEWVSDCAASPRVIVQRLARNLGERYALGTPPWNAPSLVVSELTLCDAPWPLPNVHLGVSCEDQKAADERIPLLLQCPAAVRFVSAEPLLGPIDLDMPRCETHSRRFVTSSPEHGEYCGECAADGWSGELSCGHWLDPLNGGIQWVIVGGESGPRSRPCDVAWIRSIVEQCSEAGVACFVKQLGSKAVGHDPNHEWFDGKDFQTGGLTYVKPRLVDSKGGDMSEWPEDIRVRQFPESGDAT